MRKGHDFHKDKDVGEFVKPWLMREKYPCVFFFLPYLTTFIEELLLVVEAVNCFGSGVAGLSVLTHTHTPPQRSNSPWKEKPSRRHFSLLDCAEGSRTSNLCPSCCCASTDKNGAVLPHAGLPLSVHSSRGLIVPLTHRNFWVFPRRYFPAKSWMLGLSKFGISLFLYVAFMCFLSDSIAQDGLYSPRLL